MGTTASNFPAVLLGDVCRFIGGGTPSRKREDYYNGNIPWATVKDFKTYWITDTEDHITEAGLADSASNLIPSGTVLLVTRVGLGKVAITRQSMAINQDIKAVIPSTKVLPEFLFWFLLSKGPEIQRIGTGATVKGVTLNDVRSISMPLPPMVEQRRIVDILSRAEGIVRLRREAQKKAAEIISALFIDMFGDPATNPKGWPVITLGELFSEPPILGTMMKPSIDSGRWLDLRVANIQGGQLTLADKKWLDLPEEQIARFALRSGDIVLARAIGSLDHLGKAVVVNPGNEKWTFDSHLMRLRLNRSCLLPEVLKGFLESSGGREEFLKHTRRSAVQFNINGKEIRKISIPLPPITRQLEYLERVHAIESVLAQQSTATEKSQATFDALLAGCFQ